MTSRIQAPILSHREVAPGHFRLQLYAPNLVAKARAGNFVHVLPGVEPGFDPLLRRAFSIASRQEESFDIIYRVEGRGTTILARRRAGESLDILGPLGRPFMPQESPMILVGGGVGVPPLAMLAQQQAGATSSLSGKQKIIALLGARTRHDLLCLDDFKAFEVPVSTATDDGSTGLHGRVTQLLVDVLEQEEYVGLKPTIYSCGPLPMLRAVAEVCARFGVGCQVSLEESMPCGVGVCNGCVVAVREAGDDYSLYRRICVDGPVMPAHEIAW